MASLWGRFVWRVSGTQRKFIREKCCCAKRALVESWEMWPQAMHGEKLEKPPKGTGTAGMRLRSEEEAREACGACSREI